MALLSDVTLVDELIEAYPAFMSLSALVNIILAALIVFRLIYHRRYVRNTLGVEHGTPYTNIIIMCVESSALMVIASVLFIILYFGGLYGVHCMIDIIPHIYVGGLGLNNFCCTCTAKTLDTLGYFPIPHRLSRCYRSCHTPNFTTIGARDGPDSVQHSTFKPFRSRRRGVI